ncbi:MAG: hypothetical protein HZC43_00860 [Nitrosomonadales bacterium]|nr:hypothetical protein [Nitrosomonadales bacterium]
MTTGSLKSISDKYCPRFGQTAVEMKFITEAQLKEALCCQIEEELSGQGRRLVGAILFGREWMTGDQIEQVMNALLKRMRREEERSPAVPQSAQP